MAAFSYQALDPKGKTVKGVVEGDNERQVRTQLRQQGLRPLEVKSSVKRAGQVKPGGKPQPTEGGLKGLLSSLSASNGIKLSVKDTSLVTRQLASLIQSGLPLDEVLNACANQSRKPQIKAMILQVRSRVLEGLSLNQAMAEHPRTFDDLYRAMVKAGEGAGFLGPVLEQLADYTENSQETSQKVKGAMTYPLILFVVSIGVVIALMAFVVPNLVGLFENQKAELPFSTKLLIGMSDFILSYGVLTLVVIAGLVAGLKQYLKSPKNQLKWHRLLLKIPLFGELNRTAEAARYSSTLGLLVKSGVPVLEALSIAAQVLTNRHIQAAGKEVAVSVKEGMGVAKAMDQVDEFPPLLVQMVASGETNGQLSEQLIHAASNQQRELQFTLATMMSLLEPMTILFMAGMVGFIVMAILKPMFQLNQMV
ncbi:type II secretion system inner membrane protein GspF [Marinagarivorans algicola]|uniref:type II secretion system inner membrane protein GspF n=1 Tax=Marinagarivorans algicola TaxID=1513270 RepID=UPI0006B48AB3|nr:type II secretion system inner membrane protein GspF [Marinagarivorans algicola]